MKHFKLAIPLCLALLAGKATAYQEATLSEARQQESQQGEQETEKNNAWRGNDTCAVCHETSKYTRRYPKIEIGTADIDKTVHAQFACVDCHYSGFDDYPHNKIVHRSNCGECHEEERLEYEKSTHYAARVDGNLQAPGCSDCHGFHDIQPAKVQFRGQAAVDTCKRCHANESLTTEFKLKPTVLEGFSSSYHGQMYRLGFQGGEYATCVSCHENHAIRGKDDPESSIAAANIVQTCAECHEDATEEFASYLTHWSPGDGQNAILDWAFWGLESLIWSVIVLFGLHTLLWFLHTILTTGQLGRSKELNPIKGQRVVRRFTTLQRWTHIILILCFLSLSLTGLPVKFSDAALSQWVAQHIVGFDTAAAIHRVAGIALIVLFLGHVGHLTWRVLAKHDKSILRGPNSMVPNKKDLTDVIGHVAYFLFLRKTPPRFDRWTYWEKFDYFAVFWGMFIIGASGVVLMLPHAATAFFPGWTLNLAHITHSEEALLATAFIFTIHFFNTHLRPNAFPLDDVVFTGHMTIERLQEERPAEYQRLKESGQLDSLMIEALPPWKVRLFRLLGLCFLMIGIALLILILFGLGA